MCIVMFTDLVYIMPPVYRINHRHRQAESPHCVPFPIFHVNSECLLMSCRTNKQFRRESPHYDHLTIICLSVSQRPECVWIWCEEMFNLLFWGPVMICPLLWFIRRVMTSSPGKLRVCDFLLFCLFLSGLQGQKEHFQTLCGVEYVWELQKQGSAGARRAHTWLVCVPTRWEPSHRKQASDVHGLHQLAQLIRCWAAISAQRHWTW